MPGVEREAELDKIRGHLVGLLEFAGVREWISEAMNAADQEWGEDELIDCVWHANNADARETIARIFAGADLFLMPSRFEPCGLAQMQAMTYGTVPVTTDVGGLHDTVIDDDRQRGRGNGFVSRSVDSAGIVDALHRAARAVKQPARRKALQRRGMGTDWSWTHPAAEHIALYHELLTR